MFGTISDFFHNKESASRDKRNDLRMHALIFETPTQYYLRIEIQRDKQKSSQLDD